MIQNLKNKNVFVKAKFERRWQGPYFNVTGLLYQYHKPWEYQQYILTNTYIEGKTGMSKFKNLYNFKYCIEVTSRCVKLRKLTWLERKLKKLTIFNVKQLHYLNKNKLIRVTQND